MSLRFAFSGSLALAGAIAACGGSTSRATGDAGADVARAQDGAGPNPESGAVDARGDDASDAPGPTPDGGADTAGTDGQPSYTSTCTPLHQETGTAIDTSHGRLDGYLAFVVPIGADPQCNGDDSHVHLQIRVQGSIYDVAVDTGQFTGDVNLYEADMALPDGAWSEGWHGTDALTYTSLGIHSPQFTAEEPAALGAKIQSELAGVNHVSVFGTGYTQGNGCHDVHYEDGDGKDGALVIEPLSPTPHILFFRFSTDTF